MQLRLGPREMSRSDMRPFPGSYNEAMCSPLRDPRGTGAVVGAQEAIFGCATSQLLTWHFMGERNEPKFKLFWVSLLQQPLYLVTVRVRKDKTEQVEHS